MQQGGMPESRIRFVSGLVGGMAALALPLAALADPPLEKFKKDEVGPQPQRTIAPAEPATGSKFST